MENFPNSRFFLLSLLLNMSAKIWTCVESAKHFRPNVGCFVWIWTKITVFSSKCGLFCMDLDKCVARNQHFSPKVLPARNTFIPFAASKQSFMDALFRKHDRLLANTSMNIIREERQAINGSILISCSLIIST